MQYCIYDLCIKVWTLGVAVGDHLGDGKDVEDGGCEVPIEGERAAENDADGSLEKVEQELQVESTPRGSSDVRPPSF